MGRLQKGSHDLGVGPLSAGTFISPCVFSVLVHQGSGNYGSLPEVVADGGGVAAHGITTVTAINTYSDSLNSFTPKKVAIITYRRKR